MGETELGRVLDREACLGEGLHEPRCTVLPVRDHHARHGHLSEADPAEPDGWGDAPAAQRDEFGLAVRGLAAHRRDLRRLDDAHLPQRQPGGEPLADGLALDVLDSACDGLLREPDEVEQLLPPGCCRRAGRLRRGAQFHRGQRPLSGGLGHDPREHGSPEHHGHRAGGANAGRGERNVAQRPRRLCLPVAPVQLKRRSLRGRPRRHRAPLHSGTRRRRSHDSGAA